VVTTVSRAARCAASPEEGGRLVLVDLAGNGAANLSGELGGVPVQAGATRAV
jgi:hypothetical protein